MSTPGTCVAECPSDEGYSTTSERDINVGVHFMNVDALESIGHDRVHCFCEEKGLNSSIHRNGGRTPSNETVPYESNTDTENPSDIITISAGDISSSRFHAEHSPDHSRRCRCRVLSLNIHIWLDRVPDPTNTDEIHPPSDWYRITTEMAPEERKHIQDFILAPPGRGRFYANPVVRAAMFPPEPPPPPPPPPPPAPAPEKIETLEEDESCSEKESKGSKENRVPFLKKLLGLGIQAMRYLGERESSKRKEGEGRKLLSKKRPETNPYYAP
ncbi:hypothetical protein FQN54_006807 [Arachnomyces sp. PD_36]|nr:hypothetical protein FQN54_006807 [Arachnomyces sp. PD_36]